MTDEKPSFIALRRPHWEAFRDGVKTIEWRRWGPRWNERTVYPGRAVTLSLGYSGPRLGGTILEVNREPRSRAPETARDIYPDAETFCAIRILLK